MADDVTSTPVEGTDATNRPTRHRQACQAARIADDYRSRDVVVLALTGITPIVDYFVVATGTSQRQIHAVADEISRVFKEDGDPRLGIGGHDNDSNWTLIDFGDIVVHVQDAEARTLYDLDGLWADAPRVDWQVATTDTTADTPQNSDSRPRFRHGMNLLAELRRRFHQALDGICDDPSEYTSMVRPAQDARFGDFQANCAMPLGKVTGKNPREVPGELVERLDVSKFV
ncbi:MAG: hypothetical protein Ct9H300mP1_20880 [Planctomycetaceae bacterium]|nr:MAG: hypothetical protein Ct9H300mP1_20880 [Planctomycetaceae bacterium]